MITSVLCDRLHAQFTIMFDIYAFLFNCTTVCQVSDYGGVDLNLLESLCLM